MCLFTTYPSRHGVTDPPPRRSNFSAHPPPGMVRIPRGSTTSYRRSETSFRDGGDRVVEYRRSRSRSRPREITYYEEPRRTTRSVSRRRVSDVEYRESRGSVVDERSARRSVSRVRY